jgi:hypothetical protein
VRGVLRMMERDEWEMAEFLNEDGDVEEEGMVRSI